MKEKDFQSLFTKYIKTHPQKRSAVYELKICKLPSLAFSRLEAHQKMFLLDAAYGEDKGVFHKISDMSLGQKPFDCFYVTGVDAYVVVLFYHPREKKEALFIPIANWIYEEGNCSRKSLTEERARTLATKIITL